MNAAGYLALRAALAPLGIEPAGDDWRHHARCRDVDGDLFFPNGTTGPAKDQIKAAKAICALCPVRELCLAWALDTHQNDGIWGGLDEAERRALCRERRVRVS